MALPSSGMSVSSGIGPETFGAIGDGQSHPASAFFGTLAEAQAVYPFATSLYQEIDWLAHQAMLRAPGSYVSDKRSYKMCNTHAESWVPLVWVDGISEYDAGFSLLDWSDLRAKTAGNPFDNYAIVHTRDGAPSHYFIERALKRALLRGPGSAGVGVTAALWKSLSDRDGSQVSWERVRTEDWPVHLEWSDGAYLLQYHNCDIVGDGTSTGVLMRPGAINAGENMRFYGGTLGGHARSIDNPHGAEISLFGTALDYSTQAVVNNAGRVELHGVHLEQQQPAAADKPVVHCINGGRFNMHGGQILLAGNPQTAACAPFKLDTTLTGATLIGVDCYNLSSASGAAVDGPGLLTLREFQNSGNPNLGPDLLTRAPAQDALGLAGTFEDVPNTPHPYACDPSGLFIEGGVYSALPVTNRWTAANLAVTRSTASAYAGTHSMRVDKLGPYNNSQIAALHLLIPLGRSRNLIGSMRLQFPTDISAARIQYPTVYWRVFLVRVIGHDTFGRPIYGPQSRFVSEIDINAPQHGSTEWISRPVSTLYGTASTDGSDSGGYRTPDWATHVAVIMDCQSIPAMSFYIDEFRANLLG